MGLPQCRHDHGLEKADLQPHGDRVAAGLLNEHGPHVVGVPVDGQPNPVEFLRAVLPCPQVHVRNGKATAVAAQMRQPRIKRLATRHPQQPIVRDRAV